MPIEILQSVVGLAVVATVWGVQRLVLKGVRARGRMRF
jgi:hypothetical protein